MQKGAIAGMAFKSRKIVNYLGFSRDTTGLELVKAMADHAKEFGTAIIKEVVTEVEPEDTFKFIKTKNEMWFVIMPQGCLQIGLKKR